MSELIVVVLLFCFLINTKLYEVIPTFFMYINLTYSMRTKNLLKAKLMLFTVMATPKQLELKYLYNMFHKCRPKFKIFSHFSFGEGNLP